MRLHTLLAGMAAEPAAGEGAGITPNPVVHVPPNGDADPEVTDIAMDSAEATSGSLFLCIKGAMADGHDFAAQAVARGAVAVMAERELGLGVPEVVVPSVRQAMGPLSATFWGRPSSAMTVVGVTGTNGKTTTCALLASIFDAEGWAPGVIGTLTGSRTTPEAPALQRELAELHQGGAKAVAMEVSSHALEQHRTAGTVFAAGIFTNLSQDHLDYHGTMDSYFRAKAKLFLPGTVRLAVVNRADPWGAKLAQQVGEGPVPLVTYSPEDASDVALSLRSASFSWRGERLQLNLGGRFNVVNAIAAATAARELGVSWEAVRHGLANVAPVRGRFETVDEGQPFAVVVDFAHTPAALAEALQAARELAAGPTDGAQAGSGPDGQGRVLLVFGAGGDRDRSKRPLLGRVAEERADVVIVTSDNPRTEAPLAIIEQVVSGMGATAAAVEPDRAEAISLAVSLAGPGDVVLIAGKGHETGQDFGDRVEPFDDVAVARQALRHQAQGGQWTAPAAGRPR